ncbi:Transposase, IS4 family [Escherichia coli]|nr:Transposase, IS4 family [Escherichia coli]
MGRRKLKYARSNIRFWHIADSYGLLKVRCEREADIADCPVEKVLSELSKEGANKQVISSQADSLIKISRIWADFFPANTSNQPI